MLEGALHYHAARRHPRGPDHRALQHPHHAQDEGGVSGEKKLVCLRRTRCGWCLFTIAPLLFVLYYAFTLPDGTFTFQQLIAFAQPTVR